MRKRDYKTDIKLWIFVSTVMLLCSLGISIAFMLSTDRFRYLIFPLAFIFPIAMFIINNFYKEALWKYNNYNRLRDKERLDKKFKT